MMSFQKIINSGEVYSVIERMQGTLLDDNLPSSELSVMPFKYESC